MGTTLKPGLHPDHSTPWADSTDTCDYCADHEDMMAHRHHVYVQREGASHRTADQLAYLLHVDASALTSYVIPADLPRPGDDTLEGWLEDPDAAQTLHDSIMYVEGALADAGLYVSWDDGYVIEGIETAPTLTVDIPGTFLAIYNAGSGRITRMTFLPAASSPGYFGPAAALYDIEPGDYDGSPFDITSDDGPFWRAMSDALAATTFHTLPESADDYDSTVDIVGTALPITWEA